MTAHAENVEGSHPRPADPVQRWVDLGIITPDQAQAIRADQALRPDQNLGALHPDQALGPTAGPAVPPVPVPPELAPIGLVRTSLLAEALGYLGGALILVAFGIATGRFWEDLSTASRLGLAAVAAAGMFAAGWAVPIATAPAARRLRSVLWLVSAGLAAGFLGIAGDALSLHGLRWLLFTAAATALYAAFLWWRHHLPLQHLALVTALVATVAAATGLLPDSETSPAASAWALGVTWFLLGWAGILQPRREVELIGAIVAAGATLFFAPELWGTPLALLTLAALAVLAVRLRDLPLLGIDAVAALIVLPSIVTRYFPGALSAAAALLVVGVLLVLAGVVTVRRRGGTADGTDARTTSRTTSWSTGTARDGWLGAGLVLGVTAAAVLVTALI
jgi:hypothetical protein